jgi:hypothetical protein
MPASTGGERSNPDGAAVTFPRSVSVGIGIPTEPGGIESDSGPVPTLRHERFINPAIRCSPIAYAGAG